MRSITGAIYLDYNSTTPVDERVLAAMMPFFSTRFGNPASRHCFGWSASEAVEIAREEVAALIGAQPEELVFTSGATEAINLAIKGFWEASPRKHIVTVATEHSAVLESVARLRRRGAEVTTIGVNSDGLVNLDELRSELRPDTGLVAVMYVNNETGIVQPVEAIAGFAHERGASFFCDATQAVGKLPLNVQAAGFDMMAFSAHKIYGPKGAGCLYLRRQPRGIRPVPQLDGGGHERHLRSGTLNVPGIAGLGAACRILQEEMQEEVIRIGKLRDELESRLLEIPGARLNGHRERRVAHVCNLSFRDGPISAELMKRLAVSSGSACASQSPEPSHVLLAMGLEKRDAANAIRFSLGRFSSHEDIEAAVGIALAAGQSGRPAAAATLLSE